MIDRGRRCRPGVLVANVPSAEATRFPWRICALRRADADAHFRTIDRDLRGQGWLSPSRAHAGATASSSATLELDSAGAVGRATAAIAVLDLRVIVATRRPDAPALPAGVEARALDALMAERHPRPVLPADRGDARPDRCPPPRLMRRSAVLVGTSLAALSPTNGAGRGAAGGSASPVRRSCSRRSPCRPATRSSGSTPSCRRASPRGHAGESMEPHGRRRRRGGGSASSRVACRSELRQSRRPARAYRKRFP